MGELAPSPSNGLLHPTVATERQAEGVCFTSLARSHRWFESRQRTSKDLFAALENTPGQPVPAVLDLDEDLAGRTPLISREPGRIEVEIEAVAEQSTELVGTPDWFAPPQPRMEGKRLIMEVLHPLAPVVDFVDRGLPLGVCPRLPSATAGFLVASGHLIPSKRIQVQCPHLADQCPDQAKTGGGGGGAAQSQPGPGLHAQILIQCDEHIVITLCGHHTFKLAQGGAQRMELGGLRPGRH